MKIYLFLIFIIIISFLIYFIYHKIKPIYKPSCNSDSDCLSSQRCIYVPEYSRKICVDFGKTPCKLEPTQLTQCDLNNPSACLNCVNLPEFKCIEVSYGKLDINNSGSKYADGIVTVNGGSGKNMSINIKTSNGKIINASVHYPGIGYKKNDILTVNGGINGSVILITEPKPYIWKKDKTIINIPESNANKGWCLPPIPSFKNCNELTSNTVLINTGNNTYEWGCECNIPNLFTQSSPSENCNIELACGYPEDGTLYIPSSTTCNTDADCNTGGYCYLSTTDEHEFNNKKYCYYDWLKNQNIDPRDGICKCIKGKTYIGYKIGDQYFKNCVNDSCAPNGKSTKNNCLNDMTSCCICNSGYIRCPDDIPISNTTLYNQCKTVPQCIKDPCQPLGHFDPINKTCICDATSTSALIDDDQSPIGVSCIDLCKGNGPCGNRGTCYVTGTDPNKKSACKNCKCPWANVGADQTCLYNTGQKDDGDTCLYDSDCCSHDCKNCWWGGYKQCTHC